MYQLKTQCGSLDIKDSVAGVHGRLVLRSLTDQALLIGERDEGGSGVAALLVGNCRQQESRISNQNVVSDFAFDDQKTY